MGCSSISRSSATGPVYPRIVADGFSLRRTSCHVRVEAPTVVEEIEATALSRPGPTEGSG